ncbi:microcystin-dependent protein [Dyadobacter jejuensis]|uniref:Microcystin-dependent protein n=1 Tax=Dyadobacter jejuensis TaxID=1082580 RepID=A0A316AKB3_9BACT|nr:tail fiber protein [Dyadobacter jejuensis]PWJ58076.1 microcystin-dependent protein [Dyadobacter jejuensis]
MAQPYIGEIRMFGGNFAPAGWMFCEGQLLAISENETLFQLIGTTYGGNGQTTFSLPDLRGRLPLHQGNGFTIGQLGGAEQITLDNTQIPSHSHAMMASKDGANTAQPKNAILGTSSTVKMFMGDPPSGATMSPEAIAPTGGSRPHNNIQPFLCVSFIISLFGIFPSPS